jgi:proline racemase
MVPTVDVHAEGEAGRIVPGGSLRIRGDTMAERLAWRAEHLDDLRILLLNEPRGHPSMCAVLVMPPVTEGADVSIVILEHGGFRAMSGSNTMCAGTATPETGALPMTVLETLACIDTAAGLVEATARIEGAGVRDVRVLNMSTWVESLDVPIEVLDYGVVAADIAYGGQFYAQAPAAAMGIDLGAANASAIVPAGAAPLAAARAQVKIDRPTDPNLSQILPGHVARTSDAAQRLRVQRCCHAYGASRPDAVGDLARGPRPVSVPHGYVGSDGLPIRRAATAFTSRSPTRASSGPRSKGASTGACEYTIETLLSRRSADAPRSAGSIRSFCAPRTSSNGASR